MGVSLRAGLFAISFAALCDTAAIPHAGLWQYYFYKTKV